MREDVKPHTYSPTGPESSFISLLSGWMQQGVENFFATQKILVDLAMRQNAAAISLVREQLADPKFAPVAILAELAGEGMSNFIAGQKVLLELVRQENDIVAKGVKDRVGGVGPAVAMADLTHRSLNALLEMQHDFLKFAGKQAHDWLAAVEKGHVYDGERFIELAREGVEHFVQTQEKFLKLIAEEASKAVSTKSEDHRKAKVEELSVMARQATDYFIEAQKKLVDVAGKQMDANLQASGRALKMVAPLAAIPLPDLAREGVKGLVEAEQALIESITKRPAVSKVAARRVHRKKRTARVAKPEAVHA